MTKSLLVKALAVVVAVVLLQLAVAPASQAQEGYGSGGGWGGNGGGRGFYYKVQYGDTLFAICRKFGVNPYQIARVNGLPNPNYIYAGQVLYIPAGASCPTCGVNNSPQPYPSHWQGGGGDCGNNCNNSNGGGGCGNNCNNSGQWGGGCGNNCNNSNNSGQWGGGGGCGNNCNNSGQWGGGGGCGNNCTNSGHHGGCGNNCYQQGSGYDYTGYYYDGYYPNYQRYSYTCGYDYNCY